MLVTKCSSSEMIAITSHNSWARTNPVALSNYQEARVCCPTLSQEVGKQKQLVDSLHDFHKKGSEVGGTTCCEQQCWEAGVYHLGRPLSTGG